MITIFYADTRNDPKNCRYPHRLPDLSDDALKEAFSHDYVCAEYKGNYRSTDNFIRSTCLAFDVDNDFSDDPAEWLSPEDIRDAFPGVEIIVHYSRSHMKAKNGRPARPKFHVFFPIEECTGAEEYAAMKQRVYEYFPYFDAQALDAARFFFGTENPEIECYEGTLLSEYLQLKGGTSGYADRSQCSEFARKGTMKHAFSAPSELKEERGSISCPPCLKGGGPRSGGGIQLTPPSEQNADEDNLSPEPCSLTPVFSSPIPQGQRNTTMYSVAVKVLKRFGDTDKARDLFLAEAERCVPPLDSEELAAIWNSAMKFYQKKILTDPEYVDPEAYGNDFKYVSLKPPDYSDVGQAKVFVRECKDEVCFTEATDFLRYDGKCWNESRQLALGCLEEFLDLQLADASDQLKSAVQELIELGEREEEIGPGKKYTDKLTASRDEKIAAAGRRFAGAVKYKEFVMKRRDMHYIKGALDAAKPMVRLKVSDLDKNEFLLNTPDATYDLRKGLAGAQPQDPADHITKITAVSPGEKGKEIWEEALQVFFCGDQDLIHYVQQVVGLAAIGKVYLEAIIIAYGDGRNGKSTFWNTVSRVFGSYAGNLSADTLTVGCKRNVKPEMAELKGKRLIIASELEEGMRLNTAMVKQLCSTDEIYAEKKYKDPFSFTPSHTLVLYTNHLPRVGASDAGTWRRLIVIPFNAKIEGSSDIKNYSDYLFKESAEAIMQWIIDGAEEVIGNDYEITTPGVVRKAVQAYKDSNDWFGEFLEECCDVDISFTQKSGELYTEYRAHCARNGEYTRSTTDFYTALELSGFIRKKTNKGSMISGLRLKSVFEGN